MNDKILEEQKNQTKILERIFVKIEKIEIHIKNSTHQNNDQNTYISDSLEKLAIGRIAMSVNKIVEILQLNKK